MNHTNDYFFYCQNDIEKSIKTNRFYNDVYIRFNFIFNQEKTLRLFNDIGASFSLALSEIILLILILMNIKIYHIIHIDKLPYILNSGGLLSDAQVLT